MEQLELKLMNYDEACKHLNLGKRIRSTTWEEDDYIYVDNQGFVRAADEELFKFTSDFDEDDFVLWMEKGCMVASGEQKSKLNKSDNEIESGTQETKSGPINETEKTGTRATKQQEMRQGWNGQEKIESDKTELSASIMPETTPTNLRRFSGIESTETPSTDCIAISKELKEERLASVTLLNSSANQLVKLAGKMIEDGKDNYTIDTAVKCLGEARMAMKTKLDFLKFAKELNDGK